MARDYWIQTRISLAEEDDDPDAFSNGSRFTLRYDGNWLTDEQLERESRHIAQNTLYMLKRVRDIEMKRDREAAKPFWQKWVG